MKIQNVKDIESPRIKMLVYGEAGAGKTTLCASLKGKVLILSAEAGLLSLRGRDLDFVEIKSIDDLRSAYEALSKDTVYDWVCLDSITEIAEVCLGEEKANTKDGRKAYGEMGEVMRKLIRNFRDLDKNVYFSAQRAKITDTDTGALMFAPSMPGSKLASDIPYFFDEVLALHVHRDQENNLTRMLQTGADNQYVAKDRSGKLDFLEPANLGNICDKINKTN